MTNFDTGRIHIPRIVLDEWQLTIVGDVLKFELKMGDERFEVYGIVETKGLTDVQIAQELFRRIERLARHELAEQITFDGEHLASPHPPPPEEAYAGRLAMGPDHRPFVTDP